MGEIGCGFGMEAMRKSIFKKIIKNNKKKRKLSNMRVPNFLYTNTNHFNIFRYFKAKFHQHCFS